MAVLADVLLIPAWSLLSRDRPVLEGGGVTGWNGAEETFNVTLELVRRGYSEEQIAKLWSGNLLRVMADAYKVQALQGVQQTHVFQLPLQDLSPRLIEQYSMCFALGALGVTSCDTPPTPPPVPVVVVVSLPDPPALGPLAIRTGRSAA